MDSVRKLGAHSCKSLRNPRSQARLIPVSPSRLYYFVDACISHAQTHEIAWISGKAPPPKHKQGHQPAACLLRQGTSAVSSVNPSRTQESASSASYFLMLSIPFEIACRTTVSEQTCLQERAKESPSITRPFICVCASKGKRNERLLNVTLSEVSFGDWKGQPFV